MNTMGQCASNPKDGNNSHLVSISNSTNKKKQHHRSHSIAGTETAGSGEDFEYCCNTNTDEEEQISVEEYHQHSESLVITSSNNTSCESGKKIIQGVPYGGVMVSQSRRRNSVKAVKASRLPRKPSLGGQHQQGQSDHGVGARGQNFFKKSVRHQLKKNS